MTDGILKVLVTAGLLVQLTALGLGFTSLGWRWPLIAGGSAVAAGCLVVVALETRSMDALSGAFTACCLGVLASAAWHAFSPAPAAAYLYRTWFVIELLFMLLAGWFAFFFKMTRLW
jgi:hypothetical protein